MKLIQRAPQIQRLPRVGDQVGHDGLVARRLEINFLLFRFPFLKHCFDLLRAVLCANTQILRVELPIRHEQRRLRGRLTRQPNLNIECVGEWWTRLRCFPIHLQIVVFNLRDPPLSLPDQTLSQRVVSLDAVRALLPDLEGHLAPLVIKTLVCVRLDHLR